MTCTKPIRITFVCLGNICRSPMAEAVFLHQAAQAGLSNCFEVSSRATSRWEIGQPPHPGTREILRRHNIPLDTRKRATQLSAQEFHASDYVIVMDDENVDDLRTLGPVHRLMDFATEAREREVPDPYYSGNFDATYRLIEAGCAGLLNHLRAKQD